MANEPKKMDIKEFRELGFLQEANRLFFHPLGLALEVVISDDGRESLSGVWDYRDEPEGVCFLDLYTESGNKSAHKKLTNVDLEREKHVEARNKLFGSTVQSIIPFDSEVICTWPNGEKRKVVLMREEEGKYYIIWNELVESDCKAVTGFEELVPKEWIELVPKEWIEF